MRGGGLLFFFFFWDGLTHTEEIAAKRGFHVVVQADVFAGESEGAPRRSRGGITGCIADPIITKESGLTGQGICRTIGRFSTRAGWDAMRGDASVGTAAFQDAGLVECAARLKDGVAWIVVSHTGSVVPFRSVFEKAGTQVPAPEDILNVAAR